MEQLVKDGDCIRIVLATTEQLSTVFKPENATIVAIEEEQTSEDTARYVNYWIEDDDQLSELPVVNEDEI